MKRSGITGDYGSFHRAARNARGVFLEDRWQLILHRALAVALVGAACAASVVYAEDPTVLG